MPEVSVIVATYNWADALRCSLASILAQTMGDFEVLIVGDACTDESAAVVESFGDQRLHWFNLPANSGSQSIPNNYGLERARAPNIAYLGHDDLWWPTHLEQGLALLTPDGPADVVAAAAISYGPEGSGVRAITGLFPEGGFTPRYFFPPSSMLHRRALCDQIGLWRAIEETNLPVDMDFLVRCYEAGARFASTNDLTVAKLNAAWRRDAYRRRSAVEQALMLAQMRDGGEAYRRAQLIDLARSVIENRFAPTEIDPLASTRAEEHPQQAWRRYKGALPRQACSVAVEASGLRFVVDEPFAGFEWHPPEAHERHGQIRWTGPSRRSSVPLPVRIVAPTRLTVHVTHLIENTTLDEARLSLNGHEHQATLLPTEAGTWLWSTVVTPESIHGAGALLLTIEVARTRRPLDISGGEDRRWLGLAVAWIELAPMGGEELAVQAP